MNLDIYQDINPDTLFSYELFRTFIFVPPDKLLYNKDPYAIHEDLLYNDDIFDIVYPQFIHLTNGQKRQYRSRGAALTNSNAILGRIGIYDDYYFIAIWNPSTFSGIKEMLTEIFLEFPQLKERTTILVGSDEKPILVNQSDNFSNIKVDKQVSDKTYNIGGFDYTEGDLRRFRVAYHTKSLPEVQVKMILCHPDIEKYPELTKYRIPSCEIKPKQKSKSLLAGYEDLSNPYAYKYGESYTLNFKKWFKNVN